MRIVTVEVAQARARYDAACAECLRLYVPGAPTDEWREACRVSDKLYDEWCLVRSGGKRKGQ